MEHNEPWQVYADNGLPVIGASATRDEFNQSSSLIIGASHTWMWRRVESGIEVVLQRRSATKSTWPGYLDISAAGHIDAGETPVASAIREAHEEIGITLDQDKFRYIFSLRTPLDLREFDTVFLYQLDESVEFRFNDGEVEELIWVSLDRFEEMTKNPDTYNLVPQGEEYFSLVLANLHRAAL